MPGFDLLNHYRAQLQDNNSPSLIHTLSSIRLDAWLQNFNDITPNISRAQQLTQLIFEANLNRPYDRLLNETEVHLINTIQAPILYLISNSHRLSIKDRHFQHILTNVRTAYFLTGHLDKEAYLSAYAKHFATTIPIVITSLINRANADKIKSPFNSTPFPRITDLPQTHDLWFAAYIQLAIGVKLTDDSVSEGQAEALSS